MSSERSFLTLCLDGKATPEEIDGFVDRWHDAPADRALHEFLGMTEEEYSLWLRVPDALPYIHDARRHNKPLRDVVLRQCTKLRARRLDDRGIRTRLQQWLGAKNEMI